MSKQHSYQITLEWTGNLGKGTYSYKDYDRAYEISTKGKPTIHGSSDPVFRGDHYKWNPEELFLSTLSACHMLWYLHLCADNHFVVETYIDNPTAIMTIDETGSGKFIETTLNPVVSFATLHHKERAKALHAQAHQFCFIANSVNFPLKINPTVL